MVYAALGEKERAKQVLETLSTYAWKLVNSQEFDPVSAIFAAIRCSKRAICMLVWQSSG
jgi:hypothetical protein